MYSKELPISKWADEDKPREKLLLKGRSALSNAELIGILLGSGSASCSAVDLGKQILNSVDNNLNLLAKLTINDLKKFKGIGEAKAITIASALELGRRRKNSPNTQKPKITSSQEAYQTLSPFMFDLPNEEFWIIL